MTNRFVVDEAELAKLPPEAQAEVAEAMQQAASLLDENPLAGYVPYPKQKEFHSAKDKTRAFYGGNRTGKTTAGVADDLIQLLPPDLVPKELHPYKRYGWEKPCSIRVITPDLSRTMYAVVDKFREMTPTAALGRSWDVAFDKNSRMVRFARGDLLDFMSFEQDPNKFGGVARDRIHYDEEPRGNNAHAIWRDCYMRLLSTGGDELFTMTPFSGSSWLHDYLWERKGRKGTFVIQATMYDNPYLAREAIEAAEEELTEEERRALVHGEPVHFEGNFYNEFRVALHVKRPPSPEALRGQEVVVGIDPGLKRTAVIWVAFDNDNAGIAFAELYESEGLPPEIATKIKAVNAHWGIKNPRYVIDPSSRNRATVNAEQVEAEYMREGIYCEHGQNDRAAGILEVKRRLQQSQLVISEECRNLIWEFPRYRRDPNSQDEWAAVKEDDHLLDALRYVCMARTWHVPAKLPRKRANYNPMSMPLHAVDPDYEPVPPLGVYS